MKCLTRVQNFIRELPPILDRIRRAQDINSPDAKRLADAAKPKLQMIKTAALITIAVCLILFFVLPKILTLFLFLPLGYFAYEVVSVTGNLQYLVNRIHLKEWTNWNKDDWIEAVGRGSFLGKPLLRCITNLKQ